jgi:hypothetical protein
MRYAITRLAAYALVTTLISLPARAASDPPIRTETIPVDTKVRLTLQSPINSKLSEAGDSITATLTEPLFLNGEMIMPRGTEFQGKIVAIARAKRGQRSSNLSITFERAILATGFVIPISAQVTGIDDWDKEESLKANAHGKMKGGHRGEKTLDNASKGASLGFQGAIAGGLIGGAAGASGRQILGIGGLGLAAGIIGGILLTKGSEIRVSPGSIVRIRFLKPATLPIVRNGYGPSPASPSTNFSRSSWSDNRAR